MSEVHLSTFDCIFQVPAYYWISSFDFEISFGCKNLFMDQY